MLSLPGRGPGLCSPGEVGVPHAEEGAGPVALQVKLHLVCLRPADWTGAEMQGIFPPLLVFHL